MSSLINIGKTLLYKSREYQSVPEKVDGKEVPASVSRFDYFWHFFSSVDLTNFNTIRARGESWQGNRLQTTDYFPDYGKWKIK